MTSRTFPPERPGLLTSDHGISNGLEMSGYATSADAMATASKKITQLAEDLPDNNTDLANPQVNDAPDAPCGCSKSPLLIPWSDISNPGLSGGKVRDITKA